MAHLLSIKETDKGTKYRIWSTISDTYITKWSSRDEIIKYLFWERFNVVMQNFLEDAITFPNKWITKDDMKMISTDKSKFDEYWKLYQSTVTDNTSFGNRFLEEVAKIGITIDIKDEKYNTI
jgi:hypothetical protein